MLTPVLRCCCDELYVSAVNGAPCPNNIIPCNELAFYTNKSELYFTHNTIFYFLEGVHSLKQEVLIYGVSNITLQGLGEMVQGFHETVMDSTVKISCFGGDSAIVFINSSDITIKGLTISECSINANLINLPNFYSLIPDTRVALGFFETYNVCISNCSIQNNTGIGLILSNVFDVTITSSFFSNNKIQGNVYVVNSNPATCLQTSVIQAYKLNFFDSYFSFGEGSFQASGLTVFLQQNCAYKVDVNLTRVTAYGNIGIDQANIAFSTTNTVLYYSLFLDSVVSSQGKAILGERGGGMGIHIGLNSDLSECSCAYISPLQAASTTPIRVQNSQFFENTAYLGGGFKLSAKRTGNVSPRQEIVIESCQFYNNIGYKDGSGVHITQIEILPLNSSLLFILTNLTVNNNIILDLEKSCAMFLYGIELAYIHNIQLFNNNNTGLVVYDSTVSFSGFYNKIYNNIATHGGGIAVYGRSYLIISNETSIDFLNNHASELGGGIYINTKFSYVRVCVIQFTHLQEDMVPDTRLYFANNTAGIAGSAIYGGMLETCSNYFESSLSQMISSLLYELVDVTNQPGLSVISSDALDICFCTNGSRTSQTMELSAYPGDIISIPLIATGQTGGVTQGTVSIVTSSNKQLFQIPPSCTNVSYTITNVGDNNISYVNISIDLVNKNLDDRNRFLTVNVSVFPCPPGFSVSPDSGICDCSPVLVNSPIQITCNITRNVLVREGDSWIGYNERDQCIIIQEECPYDYCKTSTVTFDITESDSLCSLNRSGLLCGRCANGLSLMLGSNQCGDCTNSYLALIIPFAVAGIALVVLLTSLNLTVSTGSINGLIFYANIVKINETIFFPNTSVPFLKQFIGWINLDLSIPVCFFDGMTAYYKTWLQFVFPFYLWIIIGLIVFLSHYSHRISKLMGSHSISVLATVILLSFTKLFRTCILVFQIDYLKCGIKHLSVWGVDANVPYWGTPHLIMTIFALFIFFFLILPYTLLLLFSPLIERYFSRYQCCKKWVKLKPLFDAYNGPYRDRYRFWTGLLLFARLVLVQVYAYNKDPTTTNVAVLITTAILFTISNFSSGLYQNKINDFLESWFLLNVIIIAATSISEKTHNAVLVSVIMAFLIFIVLVIYRFMVRIGLYTKLHSYLMGFYHQHIKKQPQQTQASINVNMLGNKHTLSHEAVELVHREGSVFVSRRRETLLNSNEVGYIQGPN